MKIIGCELNHMTNPLGFDLPETVFSWRVEQAAGGRETAARIRVWEEGRPLTDSGWAALDSLAAPLRLPLKPRTRYSWRVAVRTDTGEEAESGENFFETAKHTEPWAAQWIGCDDAEPRHPIFSKTVAPQKPVKRARLYVCGLGLYEAAWNGEKIGAEYLTPYCNDYNRWLQYQTFDVTAQLQKAGVLSVLLGNGWYKGRYGYQRDPRPYFGDQWRLMAELRLLYEDGTEETVGTDETWQVTRSAITFSSIYDGEQRDDTLPDTAPVPARLADAPKGTLCPRCSLPVTVHERLPVKELIRTPAGETVLDMGQNLAGAFRLRLHEPRGTKIRLQFGEILQNGNFYRDNLRSAKAEYVYISGGEETVIEPRFTFYGYRYVKLEGAAHFRSEDFTALSLYSDMPMAGTLRTGSDLVNRLIENTRWGMKGNFLDVPTDCPQRDERLGWTGDAQVFSPTALYLAEPYAFYAKYLRDLAEEQAEHEGMVPNYIPNIGHDLGCAAAWGDVATILPWNLYLYTGDIAILRRQYGSMRAWVDYIRRLDGDTHHWREVYHFGDWLALDSPYGGAAQTRGATDEGFIADVYYRRSARIVAKTARLLGRAEEAEMYEALAEQILSGIREEYFSPTGRCCVDTQTAALLTLSEGLHDPARAAAALETQLEMSGGKLKTGFVGTPLLCPVLSENGLGGRAYDLLLNEEYPGWLYEVKLGATTVWERWNSVNPDGSISSTGMNSLNHYAYGSIVEWLFAYAAGLRPLEEAPGFRKARIAPAVNWKLRSLDCAYKGYRVAWETPDRNHVKLSVTVPFGCEALLTLPLSDREPLTLAPGDYAFAYETVTPVAELLSTNDPIQKLLSNQNAKNLLLRGMPMIEQIPPSMQSMSMRELARKMGGGDEAVFDQLDAALAAL